MPERTSYEAGMPSWVDVATPDIEAAATFYGDLFGWDVPESERPEQTGGYRQAMKGGKPVAGAMPLAQEGQPPAWATYVTVDDAEATAVKVGEAGGSVVAEPMDVLDLGRMAVFTDPTGAFFGVWEPLGFVGAGLVNEPGALAWNELETRDPGAAKEFYGAVFGWSFDDHEMGQMGTYTEWKLGDATIGGMADIAGRVPDEVPAHWMAYFAVDDADAAVEQVKAGGGEARFGPVDIPAGRFAMVADPWGAAFAVIKLSEETRASA